jgi:hypothetical protein
MVTDLRVVASYSFIETGRSFHRSYDEAVSISESWPLSTRLHSARSHKTAIFILAAARGSNFNSKVHYRTHNSPLSPWSYVTFRHMLVLLSVVSPPSNPPSWRINTCQHSRRFIHPFIRNLKTSHALVSRDPLNSDRVYK